METIPKNLTFSFNSADLKTIKLKKMFPLLFLRLVPPYIHYSIALYPISPIGFAPSQYYPFVPLPSSSVIVFFILVSY